MAAAQVRRARAYAAILLAIIGWLAAMGLSVGAAMLFTGVESPSRVALAAGVMLAGLAVITVVPIALGRRFSRPIEAVYTGGGKRGFTWWLFPAIGLGIFELVGSSWQLIGDPKVENVFALVLFSGFAASVFLGIGLRRKGRNAGNTLIILGVIPSTTLVWIVVPPIVALVVIVAALVEIGATSRAATAGPTSLEGSV